MERGSAPACGCLLGFVRREAVESCDKPTLHIGFISTWNTRCGIAEYTRYLASNLIASVKVSVFADEAEPVRPDESNVVRCWKQSWDETVSERGYAGC